MPEGDTVHKVSQFIAQRLEGRELTAALVRGIYRSEKLATSRVLSVEALGKHMLIHLDRDLILRVHLGMNGSWHHYRPGAPWRRPKNSATVILETSEIVLVCFNSLEVEVMPSAQRKWHRQLNELGPDLLAPEAPDWAVVAQRAYRLHSAQDFLSEVLLDQRVAAGIGNVYKSELAFMGPIERDAFLPGAVAFNPWTPLNSISRDALLGIFQRARTLLQANLGGWHRTTRVDRRVQPAPKNGSVYVYGRRGEQCLRCGKGKIESAYQGLQNRITYWCPICQASPA